MENRFMNFTLTVLKLNKLVQKIKLLEISDYGLKSIHVMSIYCIYTHDKLTAGGLAKLTLEDKGAISRAVTELREKGYIEAGGRKYNAALRLTEEGKKIAEHICKCADSAVSEVGVVISNEERSVFYKALALISDKLEAYYNGLKLKDVTV